MKIALVAFLLSLQTQAGCNCMCDDGAVFFTARRSQEVLYGNQFSFDTYSEIEVVQEAEPEDAEVITIEGQPRPKLTVMICDYNGNGDLYCYSL